MEDFAATSQGARMFEAIVKISRKPWFPVLALGLFFVAFACFTKLDAVPDIDEARFHLPTIEQYQNALPKLALWEHQSASGPVPYLLWALWGKLFGNDIATLRFMTVLLAVGALWFFSRLSQENNPARAALLLVLFAFHPYFFARAFSLYTMIPAAFFALSSLWAYEKAASEKKLWFYLVLAGSAALALLSRQIYLSYVVGLFAHLSMQRFFQEGEERSVRLLRPIFALSFALFCFAGLLFFWGGATPPNFPENETRGLNVTTIGFLFVWLGVWFLPVIFDCWKREKRYQIIAASAVGLLLFFFWPLYIADPNINPMQPGAIAGVIAKINYKFMLFGAPLWSLKLFQAILSVFGALVLFATIEKIKSPYALIALAHFCLVLFIPQTWERFFLPAVAPLWLVHHKSIKNRYMLAIWAGVTAIMGIAYFLVKTG